MKLVSGIVDSGFFAQSALSAEVATKDSLGRNISETYLTGVDQVISSYATATYVNSAIITNLNDLEISARQAYHARTAYYDQNGVNLANATNSAKSGYAASAWINAHSSDYQTTAGMTAYQSAGEYYSASNPSGFLVADDITGKLDASVYAADSGNFLTAVPDTYLQNTDLYTTDGKVTAISGIPLAAGGGGDVPEGVMAESGLEYNAVDEISGYNGSAFAQYGAEKQWLQHDDTIVHVANSAQYAFGVNLSAIERLLGIDETELWSGSKGVVGDTMDLSEPVSAFNKIKFEIDELNSEISTHFYVDNTNGTKILYPYFQRTNSNYAQFCGMWSLNRSNDDKRLTVSVSVLRTNGTTSAANPWKLIKVIGIGRKGV